MLSLPVLTALSTGAIVASGVGLLFGWYFIRAQQVKRHQAAMLTATGFAAAFLFLYVTRWALYGSKPFPGEGAWRAFYFANLVPHIIFALLLAPLVIRLLHLALRKRDFAAHRNLARWVLPMWLYVSASGWLIYYLLHVRTY